MHELFAASVGRPVLIKDDRTLGVAPHGHSTWSHFVIRSGRFS
jgi:hypothetical protein